MRKLSVEEWIVKLAGIYENVRSCVRVCKGLSDEFEVKFGVHQGSVLSPLLFITVLDALSREIRRFQLTEQSFSVCLYKEKGDALDRGNYRRLELTEQAMKVIERITYSLIRQVVTINWSTLGGLYADALVIIADSMGECVRRLLTWKMGMER